jgi:ABC-type branched-subunit amino acid transport system substrate-binding protein
MTRPGLLAGVLACLWASAAPAGESAEDSARPEPFFDARTRSTEYAGPGRETPPPDDLAEVRIGWFGPSDPTDPLGGDMWRAAVMAVKQANADGGWRGKPFRLAPGWSYDPWGSGVGEVIRMVYRRHVWAIVGGIDGPTTHLAEQVVAKARVPLVSPACPDKSVTLANVPWMFTLTPDDGRLAEVLAEAIAARANEDGFVVLSADDHDSRMTSAELRKRLTRRRLVARFRFRFRQGAVNAPALAARVAEIGPGALVIIAGPADAARVLSAVRQAGFEGPVFGGPRMGRRAFREAAGAAAEGVVFPLLYRPEASPEFAEAFERRTGRPPDYAAAHAYDAVRLVIAAVRKAGLNRARIRDALAEIGPWEGATGTVQWDGRGRNRRPVGLGTVRGGRVSPLERSAPSAAPATSPP